MRSVDGLVVGNGRRGPLTTLLQREFFAVLSEAKVLLVLSCVRRRKQILRSAQDDRRSLRSG